jgi:hypothetical protein
VTATGRGLLLNANRGMAFVVQTTRAKEFALAPWLVGGADGCRLYVRRFDGAGNVRENQPQDVLASGTTMLWDAASKGWNAGAVMQDSLLNRRQTIRLGAGVAFAQIGIIGFDGQIELEALRLCGLPEDAPAILYGCPSLPAGTRTIALETSWDLPNLAAGATANVDVTVPGARRGDFADASLDTSSIAVVLDCHVWSNDKVRVRQGARHGAERQRIDGGSRGGAAVGRGGEAAAAVGGDFRKRTVGTAALPAERWTAVPSI